MPYYVAIINLKGGTAKTTTAAFLMHAFAEAGYTVAGADGDVGVGKDGEVEGLHEWSKVARWTLPVIPMSEPNMHRRLPGVVGERWQIVVIDTPPTRERRAIALSAARLADLVIVPMAPSPAEYVRLRHVRTLVHEAADLDHRPPPPIAVLFNRTNSTAVSTMVWRNRIEADGYRVLRPDVAGLQRYQQSWGSPITRALNSAYGDIALSLLGD